MRPRSRSWACASSYWKQHSSDGKTSSWRLTLPLSLSWDHRVIDGAAAARFNVYFASLLADMRRAAVLKGPHHGQSIEVKVPDIGDFKDVAGHRAPGASPARRCASRPRLISVESDKATMEIPSPAAGVVKEIKVKVGDKVSEGSVLLTLEASGARRRCAGAVPAAAAAPAAPPRPRRAAAPPRRAPVAGSYSGKADIECEVLVLGAGPGGYSAAFRSADLGMKTVLVERYADARRRLPERRLHPVEGAAAHRIGDGRGRRTCPTTASRYGAPKIDIDKLRGFKDGVVKKLTGGLAGMAKMRKVEVVTGVGSFLDPHHVEVARRATAATQGRQVRRRRSSPPGSQAVKLPFMPRTTARRRLDRRAAAEGHSEAHAGRSAAASSASRWRPSTRRSARASTWSRCSTA